jgi:hypothetical protein
MLYFLDFTKYYDVTSRGRYDLRHSKDVQINIICKANSADLLYSVVQGLVVQRWVNANPGLRFNPLF